MELHQILLEQGTKSSAAGVLPTFNAVIPQLDYSAVNAALDRIVAYARQGDGERAQAIQALTYLFDLRYDPGTKKRSLLLGAVQKRLNDVFDAVPTIGTCSGRYTRIDAETEDLLKPPADDGNILVVDGLGFPNHDVALSAFLVDAFKHGWERFIAYNLRGHRFIGTGFGENSYSARIDTYGNIGNGAGDTMDGLELHCHSAGQDNNGVMMKAGKLVVHGMMGQSSLYAAKGGEVYVLDGVAGRFGINTVGRIKCLINGTGLDYLAESCMAGDASNGGGYFVLLGITFENGKVTELETPYPGGNLMSLPGGGATYIRDPRHVVEDGQLHGGIFTNSTEKDWKNILPMLQENERLFGIPVAHILTVDGKVQSPPDVFRKVVPDSKFGVLS